MVKKNKPIVALFGGSFDPPHKGHQEIVKKAVEVLEIEKLIVLPAYLNPFKVSSLADAKMRLQWCQKLFDKIDVVEVDGYEIKEGKSVVTSQSIKHLSNKYNIKYIVIGADNLELLDRWHNFEWINQEVIWVIATRQNHSLKTEKLKNYIILSLDYNISSTQIREEQNLKDIDKEIRESLKNILTKGKK